jgi:hypothetical protein
LFQQSGETLTVEIGAGKWIDKAAVGTVSLFILWPLAVTAAVTLSAASWMFRHRLA